jgi:hypothetical protein
MVKPREPEHRGAFIHDLEAKAGDQPVQNERLERKIENLQDMMRGPGPATIAAASPARRPSCTSSSPAGVESSHPASDGRRATAFSNAPSAR